MAIIKKNDGWYTENQGPFETKHKALIASRESVDIQEKREKNLVFALDYHNTYSADPKFWNTFIYMAWMRKATVLCVSHATDQDEINDLYDSIGKVIGKKNVVLTDGKAKKPYCDAHGIDIDIWIDNNPIHIIEDPDE